VVPPNPTLLGLGSLPLALRQCLLLFLPPTAEGSKAPSPLTGSTLHLREIPPSLHSMRVGLSASLPRACLLLQGFSSERKEQLGPGGVRRRSERLIMLM